MNGPGILVLLAAMACTTTASAGDIDALMKGCNHCHGDNGVSQWEDVPTIAGIDAFGHADALFMFRDEDRPCSESNSCLRQILRSDRNRTCRPPRTESCLARGKNRS